MRFFLLSLWAIGANPPVASLLQLLYYQDPLDLDCFAPFSRVAMFRSSLFTRPLRLSDWI